MKRIAIWAIIIVILSAVATAAAAPNITADEAKAIVAAHAGVDASSITFTKAAI